MYSGTFCTVVYFNLVYELGNTRKKKKRNESLPFSSSFLAPGADASAFQS